MKYILFLIWVQSSGLNVHTVEFSSHQKCLEASAAWDKEISQSVYKQFIIGFESKCVEK